MQCNFFGSNSRKRLQCAKGRAQYLHPMCGTKRLVPSNISVETKEFTTDAAEFVSRLRVAFIV